MSNRTHDAQAMAPKFFRSAEEFRVWLEANHATATEIIVGFYSKNSGRTGITYAEAIDEALCFGWIDGLLRRVDETRHCRRFTPRKAKSTWSIVNIGHVKRLLKLGRMTAAGIAAYERRESARSGIYSFEQSEIELPAAAEKALRANGRIWHFWTEQPPGYRRMVSWWLISAKKPETRERRLQQLVDHCAAGKRLPMFTNNPVTKPRDESGSKPTGSDHKVS